MYNSWIEDIFTYETICVFSGLWQCLWNADKSHVPTVDLRVRERWKTAVLPVRRCGVPRAGCLSLLWRCSRWQNHEVVSQQKHIQNSYSLYSSSQPTISPAFKVWGTSLPLLCITTAVQFSSAKFITSFLCFLLTPTPLVLTFMWVTSLLSLLLHLSIPQSNFDQFSSLSVIFEIMNYWGTQKRIQKNMSNIHFPGARLKTHDIRDTVGSCHWSSPWSHFIFSLPAILSWMVLIFMHVLYVYLS